MPRYRVVRIKRTGSTEEYGTIEGRTWRQAWNYYKRGGHFVEGRYIIIDKKGKRHYVRY